ncbi:hypothetical protein DNF11_1965 [Malassezia restricta CBS 7877]|uniref:Uncharacterized protein n=1 Tax=Malassezia restricta (strain ATCC 96810 / NBRC 103918 / CBS 7877) TaxID=425264 RepID=A0A3G2S4H3_MALR7|nr:hypothetical protein DNF11_1965 [Malassezia restricta CBS 7877]
MSTAQAAVRRSFKTADMSLNLTPESTAATRQKNEEAIREEWIKVMQVRLVHDELQKCHRAEGENHYQVKGYRSIDA